MNDEIKKDSALSDETPEGSSGSSDGEISFIQLFRLMFGAWKLIGGIAILVTGGAISYALLATEIYQAQILLVPAKEEKSSISSAFGQFGGLAAIPGISIPADSNKEQVLATLKSRKFLGWYIEENNLLPTLFEERWDETKKEWKIEPGGELPTAELAYRAFSGLMELNEDRKTGLITLSIFWKDPEIAAEWANDLVQRLNDELRRKAIEDSKKRIGYLDRELSKTMVKDMKDVLYSLLESEERKAMLANVNEEFALQVIDPAVVPEERAKPNRRLIAILGGVGGLFLGIFVFLFRDFLLKIWKSTPEDSSS